MPDTTTTLSQIKQHFADIITTISDIALYEYCFAYDANLGNKQTPYMRLMPGSPDSTSKAEDMMKGQDWRTYNFLLSIDVDPEYVSTVLKTTDTAEINDYLSGLWQQFCFKAFSQPFQVQYQLVPGTTIKHQFRNHQNNMQANTILVTFSVRVFAGGSTFNNFIV